MTCTVTFFAAKTYEAEQQTDGTYIIKVPEIKAAGEFTIKASALLYVRSVRNIDSYSLKQRTLQ